MSEEAIERGSGNVFADLGVADPVSHKLKAELVAKLVSIMAERALTQSATAQIVGVSQPDLSRLLKGRFRDVSVDRLLRILTRLQCEVDISVRSDGRAVGAPIRLGAAA